MAVLQSVRESLAVLLHVETADGNVGVDSGILARGGLDQEEMGLAAERCRVQDEALLGERAVDGVLLEVGETVRVLPGLDELRGGGPREEGGRRGAGWISDVRRNQGKGGEEGGVVCNYW